MNSFKDEYKELKKIKNIYEEAYKQLVIFPLVDKLYGNKKLIQLDDIDQESKLFNLNNGKPIPGMIYTFLYKAKEILTYDNQEFMDIMPLIFCLRSTPYNFTGINLNMLPNKVRLKFLQEYYETYERYFINIDEFLRDGKPAINTSFLRYMQSPNGSKFAELIGNQIDCNIEFAYRKYYYEYVELFRMIEYTQWKYIPFLEPINAFRKADLSKIYKMYRESLKK